MKPEWRTTLVVELCASMRAANDYAYLPQLADALGSAGCTDDALLNVLRMYMTSTDAQRIVATIYSEESAAAVKWIDQCALECNDHVSGYPAYFEFLITYEFLLQVAARYLATGEEPEEVNSMNLSNYMFDHQEAFWKNYELATGQFVEPDQRRSIFFSCTC